jgi:hypothetical protein
MSGAPLSGGDLDSTQQLAQQALDLLGGQGPIVAAEAEAILGRVEHQRSNRAEARRHYRAAVAALTGAGADRSAAALWFDLGALFDETGDAAGARDAYRSAAASLGLRSNTQVPAFV